MSVEHPLVSVVMINYNGLPWLDIAVESILATGDVPIELIVVDDCSTDSSRDYLNSMAAKDARLRPVMLAENQGISGARNAGIEAARGEYISIIDSDDRFLPHTVKRQLETFRRLSETEPELSMLMSDAWLINENGARIGRYISRDWWDRESTVDPPLWTLPSTFFFRRDRAARFHPAYRSADAPIFVRRMEQLGPLGFTGEPLIEYRLRMSSVTNLRGAFMLREMHAAEMSRRLDRLDDPMSPDEMPDPGWRTVAAWVHGRNAKNAMANGKRVKAGIELAKAFIAKPGNSSAKLLRAFQTVGKRFTS